MTISRRQPINERLKAFLILVPTANWRGNVPPSWSEELREALSDRLVKIGFGGRLELTEDGRAHRNAKP